MAAHSIKTFQKIPISLERAWDFFSNPANLQAITPDNMGFKVISKHHGERYGPYSLWHHQHHFKEIPGGVEMTDIIHYKNPFWIFGRLANTLFVKKQLDGIFDYRFKKVEEMFGKWNA